MTTTTIEAQVRDIILVLHAIVQPQRQRLSDGRIGQISFSVKTEALAGIGEAMKRLGDSLLTEADRSAKRLEDLKMQRGRLITQRGELAVLLRGQQFLLADKSKTGQPNQRPDLLLRTKQQMTRTADHEKCLSPAGCRRSRDRRGDGGRLMPRILHKLTISEISAVDKPAQKHAKA
jgi:hypothetical protein